MNIKHGIGLLFLAASSTLVQPASAQGTGVIPLRVKAGVFLPQGDAKNFAGSTQFDGEVDLTLPSKGKGRTVLTAGYYRGSSGGNKLRMIPLTVARMFSPPNPVGGVTGNVYFGVGVGAYFLNASGGGTSTSKTRPGAFGVVGYQFTSPYFIEAKYHVTGSVNGVSPHGFALMFGRHF